MKYGCMIGILILITCAILDFLLVSGIYWALCVIFGFLFKWKIAIAIYVIIFVLQVGIVSPGMRKTT